jgi:CRP-like cAMP-binding protein
MGDVRQLKDRAAEAAARGKLDEAEDLYREALRGDPGDLASRQKLAEVLRRAGRTAEAIEGFRAVAERFARDGLLMKAIAISRTILELAPEHVETQEALARLYARRAEAEGRRPARTAVARAAVVPPPPAPEPATDFARIVLAAGDAVAAGVEEELVLDVEIAEDEPPSRSPDATSTPISGLPRFPIFSDLSREAFVALTRATALRRAGEGEVVLAEGDGGTSFYVVATGRLAVSKRDDRREPVVLAHLGEGDFFGEMALISGAPRAATVVAEAPSELLELSPEALLEVARAHPHLASSLRRFYRQRLLANAMAMSRIFRPFPRDARKRIMERFRARAIAPGEKVIREGDPSEGLFVVLYGSLDVVKRKGGLEVGVGQLREGDVFGEMSCLRKAPASASVRVRRGGSLLELPRREFDDLVVSYPQILEHVAELSDERAEYLDAILTGHAQWTEDGLVLV